MNETGPRLLICGDREWDDIESIRLFVLEVKPSVIIQGMCRGADLLARQVAIEEDIPFEDYPADWEKHKKAAGPIRNSQMLKEGKPDRVGAFHDNIDKSRGTKDMIKKAEKAGVKVTLVKHPDVYCKSCDNKLKWNEVETHNCRGE